MVKVDLTRKGNPLHERLVKHFEIKGVPSVVFIDPSGKERRDLRLVDFLPPDKFLIRMAEINKTSKSDF
jgi:thiol:disulfide interchange protein DsbD